MTDLFQVDVDRWPGIARVPHSPVRAAAARQILRRAVRGLPITVKLPDGTRLGADGPDTLGVGPLTTVGPGDDRQRDHDHRRQRDPRHVPPVHRCPRAAAYMFSRLVTLDGPNCVPAITPSGEIA